jgi:hypothetical protein
MHAGVELGACGLAEVALGVALHVDDAELDVGPWEEPLVHREQAGEVVLYDEEDIAQSSLEQGA